MRKGRGVNRKNIDEVYEAFRNIYRKCLGIWKQLYLGIIFFRDVGVKYLMPISAVWLSVKM